MKKFTKLSWAYLSLLLVLMLVSLLAGCTSDNSENTSGTTETANTIVEHTEPTTESTVTPSTESPTTATTEATTTPTTSPTNSASQTITPPAAKPIETNPPATEAPKETIGTVGVYVGPATPSTGLSWDGVSPIIYTYPDGTTGTTPQNGAKYEQVPGVWVTYGGPVVESTLPPPVNGVFTCSHCGKASGDGANGTCVRWLVAGDHTCSNCGETVPGGVCHTCDED